MKTLTAFFDNNAKLIAVILLIFLVLFLLTPLYQISTTTSGENANGTETVDTCTFMIFKNSSIAYENLKPILESTPFDTGSKNMLLYNTLFIAVILGLNFGFAFIILVLALMCKRYTTALLAASAVPFGILLAVFGGMSWIHPSAAFFFILFAFILSVLCLILYINKATVMRYAKTAATNETSNSQSDCNNQSIE